MKVILIACFLACLSLTARADAPAPVTICVISDGRGSWAIVTTNPAGPTLYTIHLAGSP